MNSHKSKEKWRRRAALAVGLSCTATAAVGSLAAGREEVGEANGVAGTQAQRVVVMLLDRSSSVISEHDPSLTGLLQPQATSQSNSGAVDPLAFTKWEHLVEVVSSQVRSADYKRHPVELSLGYFPEFPGCGNHPRPAPMIATATLPVDDGPFEPGLLGSREPARTSLLGAMENGAEFCRITLEQRPGVQCDVVLVTDGGVDECAGASAQTAASARRLRHSGIGLRLVALPGGQHASLRAVARAAGADPGDVEVRQTADGLRTSVAKALRGGPPRPARTERTGRRSIAL